MFLRALTVLKNKYIRIVCSVLSLTIHHSTDYAVKLVHNLQKSTGVMTGGGDVHWRISVLHWLLYMGQHSAFFSPQSAVTRSFAALHSVGDSCNAGYDCNSMCLHWTQSYLCFKL